MSIIALSGSFISLFLGATMLVGESGYSFDLRRKSRRKSHDRAAGRRQSDAS